MTTEAQIAANRANAQHSTGPKTPEGKARVARNALRHGFRARLIIDNPVDRGDGARFAALLTDLVAELQPVGVLEEFAVETIATCIWRLRHTVLEELHGAGMTERDRFFSEMEQEWDEEGKKEGYDPPRRDDPALATDQRIALLLRYEAHLYRQYNRALANLQALQAAHLALPTPSQDSPPSPSMPDPASDEPARPPAAPPAPAPLADHPSPATRQSFGGTFPFAETFFAKQSQSKRAPASPPSDPFIRCSSVDAKRAPASPPPDPFIRCSSVDAVSPAMQTPARRADSRSPLGGFGAMSLTFPPFPLRMKYP